MPIKSKHVENLAENPTVITLYNFNEKSLAYTYVD